MSGRCRAGLMIARPKAQVVFDRTHASDRTRYDSGL